MIESNNQTNLANSKPIKSAPKRQHPSKTINKQSDQVLSANSTQNGKKNEFENKTEKNKKKAVRRTKNVFADKKNDKSIEEKNDNNKNNRYNTKKTNYSKDKLSLTKNKKMICFCLIAE